LGIERKHEAPSSCSLKVVLTFTPRKEALTQSRAFTTKIKTFTPHEEA